MPLILSNDINRLKEVGQRMAHNAIRLKLQNLAKKKSDIIIYTLIATVEQIY